MRYETISIQVEGSSKDARLYMYLLDSSKEFQAGLIRPVIIICPGGGYAKTSDRESEPVAMRLLAMGYHVGILRYSVAPAQFPTALLELAEVMKLVHENAGAWCVDESKIFVQGFSAGGHLAATLGIFWNSDFLAEQTKLTPDILKPAGMILCYPVITSKKKYAHSGSFHNLLGDQYKELKKKVSIEKQVTEHTPPCFIWHTSSDQTVPVENSLMLAKALSAAKVPYELHVYPEGVHGLSLADDTTKNQDGSKYCEHVQSWIDLLQIWLKDICK